MERAAFYYFEFAHHKCLMMDWIYVDKNTQFPWFEWICYINDVFGTNESIMHNFIEHGNRRQENDKKTKKTLPQGAIRGLYLP